MRRFFGSLYSFAGVGLAIALTAAGCANQQPAAKSDTVRPPRAQSWPPGGNPAPAPRAEAPAPAPEQPKPAPRSGPCNYVPAVGPNQTMVALAFPTGDAASSALLIHQVMPREVRVNQPYTYEIHVTNITGGTLQSVVVTNDNLQNVDVTGSTPNYTKTGSGALTWALGDLGPCKTSVIKVTGRAGKTGISSNCLTATYANTLCASTTVVSPDLLLTKAVPDQVLLCDPITIRYEVKNSGTGIAENVVVRDTLPAGLTTLDGKTSVELPVGNLAAGQSKPLAVNVKAAQTGRFASAATANAAGDLTAKSADPGTTVVQPVLSIAAKCSETSFLLRDITYSWTVKNTGKVASNNTVVTANVPAGATFVSATEGGVSAPAGVTWNLGTLAPDQSRTVAMTVKPGAIGTYRADATAAGTCAVAVKDGCATNVKGIPAILLEVVDLTDPIEVGQNETYVITVTNQGSAPDNNIKIVCELPPEMEFVSGSGASNATANGKTVTFAALPNLAPKAKAEFRLIVRTTAEGDIRFKTTLTSDQFKRPIEETESTNIYK